MIGSCLVRVTTIAVFVMCLGISGLSAEPEDRDALDSIATYDISTAVPQKQAINSPCKYKKEDVRFLMERESALMADDIGLGKTVKTAFAVCRLSHIELLCNCKCRHSSSGYQSPAEYEMMTKPT